VHWSYPAAIRVLRVLRRCGWSCTAWQCQTAYRSAAPHSDVASLRALLLELGVGGEPIPSRPAGASETGRSVNVWTLRPDCWDLARAILAWEDAHPDGNGRAHLDEIRALAAARRPAAQAALF